MRKRFGRVCLIGSPVAVLALLFLAAIFVLPAQYHNTFLGALRDKMALIQAQTETPRIITVGGSGAAFGQRSDLLEAELPGYQVINFGLYAGLGTAAMMDLSLPYVREGDIVILSPEQNQQTLSGYFGAEAMWQAADGAWAMLTCLSPEHARMMAAEALPFAVQKTQHWLSGAALTGDGIYRRECFNRWGDLTEEGRAGNIMPGGMDPNMPVSFDPALPDAAFIGAINSYAAACRAKGARVFYRFCPMNEAAVSHAEAARMDAYRQALEEQLDIPVLGTPQESVFASEWFFDTNFHLNSSGAVLNTIRLAEQLKRVLGIPGTVKIPEPQRPGAEAPELETAYYQNDTFIWCKSGDAARITGLTSAGKKQSQLELPRELGGAAVTAFDAEAFAGNPVLQEIVLPESIRVIEDGSFSGCTMLERIVLRQSSPSRITVGTGLLDGTESCVVVPAEAYGRYQTSYFWAAHGARIVPGQKHEDTAQLTSSQPMISGNVMYVDANGGVPVQGNGTQAAFALSENHLRSNTPMGQQLFRRDGYAPLCWNTHPDGSGEMIPFGSRVDSEPGKVLYMQWVPLEKEAAFAWTEAENGCCITGWQGDCDTLAIPASLGGQPVVRIAEAAFEGAEIQTVILPESLRAIDANAFKDSTLQTLWLYDSLEQISDRSFHGCEMLQTLYIGADTAPRYSTSYFGAFADKLDWLRYNARNRKIVMFGGSASRYAYNSKELHEAFPDWQMVNMGVYAYTNAMPQMRIIRQFMQAGDILLSAPEFDTTETQFCPSNALDDCFWAMAEADYACVSLLDLRQYSKVFSSLQTYLRNRFPMPEHTWEESPKWYDDDGARIDYETYNQYGDYTLLRPGGGPDELLAYFRADYTVEAFPAELIESLNAMYREFQGQGITVLFAYAPRNHSSLTPESTPQQWDALHALLQEQLCVPVIQDIRDSLYSGYYFYLIDSHLSDEGVYLHTKRIIKALKAIGVE